MSKEITIWDQVMATILKMPGIKVDREDFLRKELSPYCTAEELPKAIQNPVNIISQKRIDAIANACISNQTAKAVLLSAAAGLPGGLAMAATIPADTVQYSYHTLKLAQKLAYLYGFPDLCDEKGELSEVAQGMLTTFMGVMMGAAIANDNVRKLAQLFAAQVAKRLPQQALAKTAYYPIIKQIAKWVGINLTKGAFGKIAGRVISIIGGIMAGGITLATFRPGAKRLQKKLREQMYEVQGNSNHIWDEEVENTEYEDIT